MKFVVGGMCIFGITGWIGLIIYLLYDMFKNLD